MSRGAFIDSKGVRWDTNDADYEGFLSKQSRWVKGLSLSGKYVLLVHNNFCRMEEEIFYSERVQSVLFEGNI